ncbi:MAG: NUDIX domain-containing protein [Candidatus Latescibacteria bacterium]|nr:NUDIX domain-containing protein [Candidatus Latescibacterota bacterium]
MPDQLFPEPTVGALILDAEDRILLVKSHKFNGQYVIPGGHIELGETMEVALKREIREETGLSIYDIQFISYQEFIFDSVYWKKRHFIFFDFSCRTDQTQVILNDEGQDYRWISLADYTKLPIEPYTLKAIQDFLSKRSNAG